jgi:hypothetical protein
VGGVIGTGGRSLTKLAINNLASGNGSRLSHEMFRPQVGLNTQKSPKKHRLPLKHYISVV